MCSLCGVLGGNEHWADAAERPGVYTRNTGAVEHRRERRNQVRVANRILARFDMSLTDWQGTAFLLSTRTGKTAIIPDLGHLWPMAERLAGRLCDPLSLPLIEHIERSQG